MADPLPDYFTNSILSQKTSEAQDIFNKAYNPNPFTAIANKPAPFTSYPSSSGGGGGSGPSSTDPQGIVLTSKGEPVDTETKVLSTGGGGVPFVSGSGLAPNADIYRIIGAEQNAGRDIYIGDNGSVYSTVAGLKPNVYGGGGSTPINNNLAYDINPLSKQNLPIMSTNREPPREPSIYEKGVNMALNPLNPLDFYDVFDRGPAQLGSILASKEIGYKTGNSSSPIVREREIIEKFLKGSPLDISTPENVLRLTEFGLIAGPAPKVVHGAISGYLIGDNSAKLLDKSLSDEDRLAAKIGLGVGLIMPIEEGFNLLPKFKLLTEDLEPNTLFKAKGMGELKINPEDFVKFETPKDFKPIPDVDFRKITPSDFVKFPEVQPFEDIGLKPFKIINEAPLKISDPVSLIREPKENIVDIYDLPQTRASEAALARMQDSEFYDPLKEFGKATGKKENIVDILPEYPQDIREISLENARSKSKIKEPNDVFISMERTLPDDLQEISLRNIKSKAEFKEPNDVFISMEKTLPDDLQEISLKNLEDKRITDALKLLEKNEFSGTIKTGEASKITLKNIEKEKFSTQLDRIDSQINKDLSPKTQGKILRADEIEFKQSELQKNLEKRFRGSSKEFEYKEPLEKAKPEPKIRSMRDVYDKTEADLERKFINNGGKSKNGLIIINEFKEPKTPKVRNIRITENAELGENRFKDTSPEGKIKGGFGGKNFEIGVLEGRFGRVFGDVDLGNEKGSNKIKPKNNGMFKEKDYVDNESKVNTKSKTNLKTIQDQEPDLKIKNESDQDTNTRLRFLFRQDQPQKERQEYRQLQTYDDISKEKGDKFVYFPTFPKGKYKPKPYKSLKTRTIKTKNRSFTADILGLDFERGLNKRMGKYKEPILKDPSYKATKKRSGGLSSIYYKY